MATAAAAEVGLEEKLGATAGALSGGQRRKLSVALAFVGNPSGELGLGANGLECLSLSQPCLPSSQLRPVEAPLFNLSTKVGVGSVTQSSFWTSPAAGWTPTPAGEPWIGVLVCPEVIACPEVLVCPGLNHRLPHIACQLPAKPHALTRRPACPTG